MLQPVATEKYTVNAFPDIRAKCCLKCPFTRKHLDQYERIQASELRRRIAANPETLWGCHEDAHAGKPKICAGFANRHKDRLP